MRGKIFILLIIGLLLLASWPYIPNLYDQKPSEHDKYDNVPAQDVVPGIDSDGDKLKDLDEIEMGTDPLTPDSDGDGFNDGEEYRYWVNRHKDEEEDFPFGILNWLRERHPFKTDSELLELFKPLGDLDFDFIGNLLDADSDGDGLGDGYEIKTNTDPANPDTDGDGVPDREDPNPTDNKLDPSGISEDWKEYTGVDDPDADPDFDGKPNRKEWEDRTSPTDPGDTLNNLQQDSVDMNNFFDSNLSNIIFRVDPLDNPKYWRLTAFDHYNANLWSKSDISSSAFSSEIQTDVTVYKNVEVQTFNITFWGAYYGYMPTALNTVALYDVKLDSKIYTSDYEPEILMDSYDGYYISEYVRRYTFATKVYDYDPQMLLDANAATGDDIQNYLQLPNNVPKRVKSLAESITLASTTPYESARALTQYLRENFDYTLTPPVPEDASTDMVDWFLFDSKAGKCTEFASAFVILARYLDIPTRIAVGFAIGNLETSKDGEIEKTHRVVREGHKHAWPEILLEGVGWIPFEVTAPYNDPSESTGVNTSGTDPSIHNENGTGSSGTEYQVEGNITDPNGDPDQDGLTNFEEAQYGTNPTDRDTDKDKLTDGLEVNVLGTDPLNPDTDSDGLTDYFEINQKTYSYSEVDWDNDGDLDYRTDPLNPDTDSGGMLDGPEFWNKLNPLVPGDDSINDRDGDGLSDENEIEIGTDPDVPDTDGDGLKDGIEFYTYLTDPTKKDTDGDGLFDGDEKFPKLLNVDGFVTGYVTDPLKWDTDGDGLSDGDETNIYLTSPLNPDTDGDGLFDGLELDDNDGYTTDPLNHDTDGDHLADGDEDKNRNGMVDPGLWNDGKGPGETDPNNMDSDGGKVPDGAEVIIGTNPLDPSDDSTSADTDHDGVSDVQEVIWGTNVTNKDTDSDGLWDGEEIFDYLTDPLLPDTDGDTLSDGEEAHLGADNYITNPLKKDTDNDSLEDAFEIYDIGTDPTNKDTDGDGLFDGFEYLTDFNLTVPGKQNTDPLDEDTDDGGVNDGSEFLNGFDPLNATDDIYMRDIDKDGLTDDMEMQLGTNVTNPDTDGDNLLDGKEILVYKTDPIHPDTDKDGLIDGEEVVSGLDGYITDPLDPDTDNDNLNDSVEAFVSMTDPTNTDTDNDGLDDFLEVNTATSPVKWDTDGDLLPDGWRDMNKNFVLDPGEYEDRNLNGVVDTGKWNGGLGPGETDPLNVDTDGGGAWDSNEILAVIPHNPLDPSDDADIIDTDRDGLTDLQEAENGTDPNKPDTDDDGIGDKEEIEPGDDGYITLPLNPDSDNDTILDGEEVILGNDGYMTNPLSNDTDGDNLTDAAEINKHKTNPTKADSDGDGIRDDIEVAGFGRGSRASASGTDPNNPDSDSDGLPDGFIDGWGYNSVSGLWGKFGTGPYSTDKKPTIGIIEGSFIYAEGENVDLNGVIDTGPWNDGAGPGETNPSKADTDGGGAFDGIEIIYKLINSSDYKDPLNPNDDSNLKDTDRDGLTDDFEKSSAAETSWLDPDTDDDGLWDGNNVDLDYNGVIDYYGELVGHHGYLPTQPIQSDSDGDGLNDGQEFNFTTNPNALDSDNDGLWDGFNVYSKSGTLVSLGELTGHNGYAPTNPLKPDSDNDTLWDGMFIRFNNEDHIGEIDFMTNPNDKDTDHDELYDNEEIDLGLNATNWDTDGGSIGDGVELFRIPPTNPKDKADDIPQDTDGDGIMNHIENSTYIELTEVDWDSDPNKKLDHYTSWLMNDTDSDGLSDGSEVFVYLTNPLIRDTDGDGLMDSTEVWVKPPNGYLTDPNNPDTDGDSIYDGWFDFNKNGVRDLGEFEDRDLDGQVDKGDWNNGQGPGETDPSKEDTDGGGTPDLLEIMNNMDPLDPSDDKKPDTIFIETSLAMVSYPKEINKTEKFEVTGSVQVKNSQMPLPNAPVEIFVGYNNPKYLAGSGETDSGGKFQLTCTVDPDLPVGKWPVFVKTLDLEEKDVIYNGTRNRQNFITTVYSNTEFKLLSYNSKVRIGSAVTLSGILTDVGNLSLGNQNISFSVILASGKTINLETITTDSQGNFNYIFDTPPNKGFEIDKHSLIITFKGGEYLRSTNLSVELEILSDIADIQIEISPTEQIVGKWIWVNGTIKINSGPAPKGTLDIVFIKIITGYKFTDVVELNGTFDFAKFITLPKDISAGQYRVYVDYSDEDTSNVVTLTVIGLSNFVMEQTTIHRGDPPKTIFAALVDNTNSGLASSHVTVEFENQLFSFVTNSEGKFFFEFEAVYSHPLGIVPVTLTYDGDDQGHTQYLGISEVHNLVVSSPTKVIMESYPKRLNRSEDLRVTGRVLDDRGDGVPNSNIAVYISHSYLQEFVSDGEGKFTIHKLIPKSINIGIRTLELEYVGNDKYENSTASELITIFDEPLINLRTATELVRGEPFRVVVELRDPNGLVPLANEILDIEVGGKKMQLTQTNLTGMVELAAVFPSDVDEVSIKVRYDGDSSKYLLPIESTYTLSLKSKTKSPEIMQNLGAYSKLILIIVLILIVFYFYAKWRKRHIKEIQDIITEMADELETTDKVRKVIYNAYRRFLSVLQNYGFMRKKSDTPREFARAVRNALPDIDRKHLHKLTNLFEEARYSDHELTNMERFSAVRSLRKIRDSLEEVPTPQSSLSFKRFMSSEKKSES